MRLSLRQRNAFVTGRTVAPSVREQDQAPVRKMGLLWPEWRLGQSEFGSHRHGYLSSKVE